MLEFSEEQIIDGQNKAYLEAGHDAYFGNGFRAGVKFVLDALNKSFVLPSTISTDQSELVCPKCEGHNTQIVYAESQCYCEDCNDHFRA